MNLEKEVSDTLYDMSLHVPACTAKPMAYCRFVTLSPLYFIILILYYSDTSLLSYCSTLILQHLITNSISKHTNGIPTPVEEYTNSQQQSAIVSNSQSQTTRPKQVLYCRSLSRSSMNSSPPSVVRGCADHHSWYPGHMCELMQIILLRPGDMIGNISVLENLDHAARS